MTLPLTPVIGDILQKGGKEYEVVAADIEVGGNFWAREVGSTTVYVNVLPSDYGTYTKKEPVFEVGHVYVRDGEAIQYTVALVDGVNVLLWWTDGTYRFSSWIAYEERKNFVEV